ncbi:MAG: SpoIID/LytB domain-containing protein [Candidatus Roizmanbacteria bacterium]|nr:MAG: SpoIID/LytB domain-containing protein [Candidatus Roizmanbacteria bacterium]
MRFSFILFTLSILVLTILFKVNADEYDDITKQLNDLKHSLESSQKATATNEKELVKLNTQFNDIKNKVAYLEGEIVKKEREVKEGEKALVYQKKLLDQRAISYYKNLNKSSMGVMEILVSEDLTQALQNFFYQKTLQDEDRRTITKIVLYIKNLEGKKTSLEIETNRLTIIKQEVDKQSKFLSGEVSKSKTYESKLQQQIAQLSARQKEILAQKLSSLGIPQSAYTTKGGCVDDREVDPGFSPRIAFFTFGVPNRVGLNQYGAKGRAEAGQNAEQILKSYYNAEYTAGYSTGGNIHVVGTNEYGQSFDDNWNIEEYLKHLYEMPTNWASEALKAQAIAARSYALAYTNNGQNSICPSQQCQVVKREENSDSWKNAVNDTAGIVMTNGGQPIKAWFSSTHGGYVFSSGDIGWSGTAWTKNARDTTGDVSNFSDLLSNAFDKASPWFYCDWGSRAEYNKTAWLKSDEVADIVNVLLLAKMDSSTQNHLSQIDKPNPDGTDTWDKDRVKSELRSRGKTPFNSISDISIDWDRGTGKTTSVNLSGDGGSVNFSGSEFKNFFNLRAPASIQIVGPLFNVEKK